MTKMVSYHRVLFDSLLCVCVCVEVEVGKWEMDVGRKVCLWAKTSENEERRKRHDITCLFISSMVVLHIGTVCRKRR